MSADLAPHVCEGQRRRVVVGRSDVSSLSLRRAVGLHFLLKLVGFSCGSSGAETVYGRKHERKSIFLRSVS